MNLYEAADIDGASRWQKIRYITIPGIVPTVVLMSTLALGNILNAGFDQVFNMYNPAVYRTGDILDTFVYRIGLKNLQFHLGTAVGLSKSLISMLLILLSYKLADKFAGYRIF
jgi:putative aldouronate transport system permease protein